MSAHLGGSLFPGSLYSQGAPNWWSVLLVQRTHIELSDNHTRTHAHTPCVDEQRSALTCEDTDY